MLGGENEEKCIEMSTQKLLVIAPSPPLANSGGGIAIFGDLYELTQRGIEVDLVCFLGGYSSEQVQSLHILCCNLVLVEGPPAYSLKTVLKALWWQQPMVVVHHESPQMKASITKLLSQNEYAAILVEFSFMLCNLTCSLLNTYRC